MNEHFTPAGYVRVVPFYSIGLGRMVRVAIGVNGLSNNQEIPEAWWLERTQFHARQGCNAVAACWWAIKEWEQEITRVSDN